MRQVPVNMSWIINAFENSSEHSEYYLDMQTGDVRFYSPMDFPEHGEIVKKLDKQPDRFIKLPKLDSNFCLKVKKDYISLVDDPYLKGLLEKAIANQESQDFRKVLMEFEDARRRWYTFESSRYKEFLLEWFREKGIELVDKPPANILEYNKKN